MKHESSILKQIKSYYMRRKSAQEAWNFERISQRDPFLYEALEGYEEMLTSDIQQALDELDDRLDQKTRKTILIHWKQAVAAVLILSAGISVFYLGKSKLPVTSDAIKGTESPVYSPRTIDPDFQQAVESYQSEGDMKMENALQEITTKVQATSAEVESQKTSETRVIDSGKDQQLTPKKDSSKPSENKPLKSETSNSKDKPKSEDLAKDQNSVAPSDAKKVDIQKPTLTEPKTEQSSSKASIAIPKDGMPAYKNYLRSNLKKSEGMPSGNVVLSFEFDKNGYPRKVLIDKSLCTACDAEAIRLLLNGTTWEASDKKERVQLTVPFD